MNSYDKYLKFLIHSEYNKYFNACSGRLWLMTLCIFWLALFPYVACPKLCIIFILIFTTINCMNLDFVLSLEAFISVQDYMISSNLVVLNAPPIYNLFIVESDRLPLIIIIIGLNACEFMVRVLWHDPFFLAVVFFRGSTYPTPE